MYLKENESKSYRGMLKQLLNLQFQYAVKRQGELFCSYISAVVQEHSAAGAEIRHVLGENFSSVTAEDIIAAKEQFLEQCRQIEKEGVFIFLEYLLDVFAADEFEQHCIRLLFAMELDPCYSSVAALLHNHWEHHYATPYLAQLTYEKMVDISQVYETFAEENLLQRFFLKRGKKDTSVFFTKVQLSERMLDFMMETAITNQPYGNFLKKWSYYEKLEPWLGEKTKEHLFLERVLEEKKQDRAQLVYLYGEEGSGKRFSIQNVCMKQKRNCVFITLDSCGKAMETMDDMQKMDLCNGIMREVIFFQSIPVLLVHAEEKEKIAEVLEETKILLEQLLAFFSVVFLSAKEKLQMKEDYVVTYLSIQPVSLLEGKAFWEAKAAEYAIEDGMDIGSMANRFRLTKGKIKQVLKNAEQRRKLSEMPFISKEMVTEECYEVIEQSMGKKAVKVPAVYQMKDLILPEKQKQQLMDACNQVKYKHKVYEEWGFQDKISYGKGISMAFIGAPGTGKTMAAQVIARELGMELYKVELSCIVSKYVGETEKNLNEIFEQAQKSQVILFFDEADALFSKRTEGKETTDKYSNMEAAFLLQKMEGYDGITVLATNLFHHFDEAFKRRLKIVVEFPLPNVSDRKRLWQTMIPDRMCIGEIDFDYLAGQFELSGSNIRNILLHGAFLAAARHKPMDMAEIIPAIKNEYAKNGKNLLKEDVSEYYMYL